MALGTMHEAPCWCSLPAPPEPYFNPSQALWADISAAAEQIRNHGFQPDTVIYGLETWEKIQADIEHEAYLYWRQTAAAKFKTVEYRGKE